MKKGKYKVVIACVGALCFALMGCNEKKSQTSENMVFDYSTLSQQYADATIIEMNGDSAKLNGTLISEYDYTWHCDPSTVHEDVKNAPAEYYTGTKPEPTEAVYIDHELYYYPKLDIAAFKQITYDGEKEWAYYYEDSENNDYIFSTLPVHGGDIPEDMMHTEDEAAKNKVLHIMEAGTYVLTGSFDGQVKIDLGEDAFKDETKRVTIVLANADIECSVAPGLIFENVYECDNSWEEREEYSSAVDTSNAGALIVIADGTTNQISGKNVYRMLKTKYKDEDSTDTIKLQKKMRKIDGALYSYMTMAFDGENNQSGTLTVDSGFEGIDSELHLEFRGGKVVINSQDDGVNVNEDHVSVAKFTGGEVIINPAQGSEGDGVDSNGYIVVDGGSVSVNGVRIPDSALDSEDGVYYNGGTIIIDGETKEYNPGDVFRETGGMNGGGPGGMQAPPDGEFPDGMQAPPDGEFPDGMQAPPNGEKPDGMMAPPNGERPDDMKESTN